MDSEKIRKIWQVVKQIIEIVIAALCGLGVATSANAMGFKSLVSSILV